jgi:hypothetical protein
MPSIGNASLASLQGTSSNDRGFESKNGYD